MKFMIPFLIAMLPVAAVAQSQSGVAPGVPSLAIPKTTGVMVIQTAKQGVTPPSSVGKTKVGGIDLNKAPMRLGGRGPHSALCIAIAPRVYGFGISPPSPAT
jgi:hypothetical protein